MIWVFSSVAARPVERSASTVTTAADPGPGGVDAQPVNARTITRTPVQVASGERGQDRAGIARVPRASAAQPARREIGPSDPRLASSLFRAGAPAASADIWKGFPTLGTPMMAAQGCSVTGTWVRR